MNEQITRPPQRIDSNTQRYYALMEQLSKLIKEGQQNTELTPDQRVLLPMLRQFSKDLFPASTKMAKSRYGLDIASPCAFLKDFIVDWELYGASINRKGRIEFTDVLKGFGVLQSDAETDKKESKMTK